MREGVVFADSKSRQGRAVPTALRMGMINCRTPQSDSGGWWLDAQPVQPPAKEVEECSRRIGKGKF
jgi:hypothetical protein